jgi:DNA-binding NarL/FixJ family response regulator
MERKPVARILIADDHRLLAEACKSLLEPEFQVVGVVTDGRSLLKAAAAMKPDVIILDIAMPHLNGLDAGDQINRDMPRIALVYLTMSTEPYLAAEAFRRGASGYVLKQSASDELLIAVRKAVQGASYLSPMIAKETVTFLINQGKQQGEEERTTPRQTKFFSCSPKENR